MKKVSFYINLEKNVAAIFRALYIVVFFQFIVAILLVSSFICAIGKTEGGGPEWCGNLFGPLFSAPAIALYISFIISLSMHKSIKNHIDKVDDNNKKYFIISVLSSIVINILLVVATVIILIHS